MTAKKSELKYTLFFLLPSIIILLFLSVYPTLEAIDLSLHNRNLLFPWRNDFVGADNFIRLLSDRRFLNSLKVSFTYSAANVILSISIGVVLALFTHEYLKGKLKSLLSFCYLLPFVIPRVSTGFMWRLMYNPLIGIYNYFLRLIGIGPIDFLGSPNLAFFSVVIVDVWQWCFFIAVLLMASMELIPREPAEAASLDGASRLQVFRYIIFPFLKPSLVLIIYFRFIESLRSFDIIYNMTRGGPGTTLEILDLYAYTIGISTGQEISYAASMSLIMLFITIVVMSMVSKRWFPE